MKRATILLEEAKEIIKNSELIHVETENKCSKEWFFKKFDFLTNGEKENSEIEQEKLAKKWFVYACENVGMTPKEIKERLFACSVKELQAYFPKDKEILYVSKQVMRKFRKKHVS